MTDDNAVLLSTDKIRARFRARILSVEKGEELTLDPIISPQNIILKFIKNAQKYLTCKGFSFIIISLYCKTKSFTKNSKGGGTGGKGYEYFSAFRLLWRHTH